MVLRHLWLKEIPRRVSSFARKCCSPELRRKVRCPSKHGIRSYVRGSLGMLSNNCSSIGTLSRYLPPSFLLSISLSCTPPMGPAVESTERAHTREYLGVQTMLLSYTSEFYIYVHSSLSLYVMTLGILISSRRLTGCCAHLNRPPDETRAVLELFFMELLRSDAPPPEALPGVDELIRQNVSETQVQFEMHEGCKYR